MFTFSALAFSQKIYSGAKDYMINNYTFILQMKKEFISDHYSHTRLWGISLNNITVVILKVHIIPSHCLQPSFCVVVTLSNAASKETNPVLWTFDRCEGQQLSKFSYSFLLAFIAVDCYRKYDKEKCVNCSYP